MTEESPSGLPSATIDGHRPRVPFDKVRGSQAMALVALLVVAIVAGAIYWWSTSQPMTPPPTPFQIGLQPGGFTGLTAKGTGNALGGCSGPGPGLTECCYSFTLIGQAGTCNVGDTCVSLFPTTADNNSFSLENSMGLRVPFANVTLLDSPTGALMAVYAPGTGWSAVDHTALPIELDHGDQLLVLNVGSEAASGDTLAFTAWDGVGGTGTIP
jgi:hypothetical protein